MHKDCRVERRKNWQYHRRSLNPLDLLRSTFREGAILLYRDTRSCPAPVSKLHGEERGMLEPPPPPPIIWTRPHGRNCRFTSGMHVVPELKRRGLCIGRKPVGAGRLALVQERP
jgi:hypothetical protein